jgi:hypothetical protein
LILLPVIAVGGSDDFQAALDFAAGVLSLVSLTASVGWGLIATDRLLLSTRHRLIAQAIHRTTAISSLAFLLLHITVKVALGHVALIGALIPFGLGVTGTAGLIGFGSLAAFLMVTAATTGALRSALAGNIRTANRWRPLHMLAYPAWCFALMHGLYAGRPAATWVTTMYTLSLLGVVTIVSARLMPRPVQRQIADKITSLTRSGSGFGRSATEEELRRGFAGAASDPVGASAAAGPNDMGGRGSVNGIPSQRPYEQDFQRLDRLDQSPFAQSSPDQPRAQPRRLPAPSPQLYEVPLPPEPEPTVSAGPGPGIAAAYRAVSLAAETAPLAERVPMTEELPIISETGPPPDGMWPTPSPPPPAQAVPSAAPAPTPPPYDPAAAYGPPQAYAPSASYDAPSSYDAAPSYDAPSAYGAQPGYDTPQPYGAPPAYEPPAASFDPLDPLDAADSYGASASYDTSSAYNPATPYETPSPPYAGSTPEAYDETAMMPGPLFPPPAGEPWHAPAGDRP